MGKYGLNSFVVDQSQVSMRAAGRSIQAIDGAAAACIRPAYRRSFSSMSSGLSRRDLFRGASRRGDIRPPWALPEASFTDACDRCGACIRACPEHIVERGDAGFPVVVFQRGPCSFCGDCAAACATGALRREGVAWNLLAVVGGGCLSVQGTACRICGEWCAEGAIRFRPMLGGRALPEVSAVACTGCGGCIRPCPVSALSMQVKERGMAACA